MRLVGRKLDHPDHRTRQQVRYGVRHCMNRYAIKTRAAILASLCVCGFGYQLAWFDGTAAAESTTRQATNSGISTSAVPIPPQLSTVAPSKEALVLPNLPNAKNVILLDEDTGEVLFERNADQSLEPASMTKLVTLSLLFDEIAHNRIQLSDQIEISTNAWRRGGARSGSSTMFAEPGSLVSVRDIILGVTVASGNDAAIAIAEHIAGSEEQFAHAMNIQAKIFGMTNSHFENATGWPGEGNRTTARDIARLARQMRLKYPNFQLAFATKSFEWNAVKQYNRNKLLFDDTTGVDGMKTGYVAASGYSVVLTSQRDDWRLIGVLSGLPTKSARTSAAKRLLDWGYGSLTRVEIFSDEATVAEMSVYGGSRSSIGAQTEGQVQVIVPRLMVDSLSVTATVQSPIVAPVRAGELIGEITVTLEDIVLASAPVFAQQSVERGGTIGRAWDGFLNSMQWDTPVQSAQFGNLAARGN